MFLLQDLKMELKVKNLASSDSRGYDLQKEVMVKVTHQRTHQVRLWGRCGARGWAGASGRDFHGVFWEQGCFYQLPRGRCVPSVG